MTDRYENNPSNPAITADEQREFLYLLKKAARAARALRAAMANISRELARYGKAPAADGEAQPVAWVAADTLNSPHPACVSSLAYMSQLDREQGREYVPLYAAPKPPVAPQAEPQISDAIQEVKRQDDARLARAALAKVDKQ